MKTLHFLVLLAALGAPAMAQNVKPCWITDTNNDDIYRCVDLTPDDDYHDAGEIVTVYDAAIGSEPLQVPTGIAAGVDGTMGISDTGEDSLFLLRDFNGDGDAQDPGEFWRFFDGRAGGNLSGIPLNSANSIYYEPTMATWWAANAGSGSTPFDTIVAMKDLNGDADANDAGEAFVFWTAPISGDGSYNPMAVHVEPSILPPGPTFASGARVYYSEIGSANPRGVYTVFDLNNDGDADDALEWLPYLTPTTVNPAFYWSIDRDSNGWFYTADTGNEVVWRFRDNNNDRDTLDMGESFAWYPVGAASLNWDLWAADDGSVYLLESQAPDRLQRLFDADANDVIVPGEIIVAYNDTISPVVFGNPRGIDGDPVPAAGAPYCFGDGSGTACPCSPVPVPDAEAGKGCPNSLFPGGARLETAGTASVTNDTLSLIGRYMPNGSCLYFQGTATVGGGLGTAFGDGLRCVGGTVRRFQVQANVDFRSRYPGVGNNPITIAGLVVAPATHMYQGWYRNGNPTFCTADTFNLTNALTVAWGP